MPSSDRHGVQLHNIIKALASRYELDVMSLRAGDLPYVEKYLNARMLRVPVGDVPIREQVEVFRRAVRRQVEGNEYEVIHFRSAFGGKPVCGYKENLESRLVFEVAISPLSQPRPADVSFAAESAMDEKYCFDRADIILAASTIAADHLMGSAAGKALSVLVQGVDVDFFDWEESPPKLTHHVLYAGRIEPGRGIRLLLKAMAEVFAGIDGRLVLVGPVDKEFEPVLATTIDELNLRQRVILTGAVSHEDMPRILSSADICVAPSVPDGRNRPLAGYPNKVLEAMACRRAVVVPRSPLMEEIAGGTSCLGFFESGSAADLAAEVMRLLVDEGERKRLADMAYSRIRTAYTASGTRRMLLSIYRALIPSGTDMFYARPGLDQAPGRISADPETTTAKRFHEFHDTATISTPVQAGGWTPTGGRDQSSEMVSGSFNVGEKADDVKEDSGTVPNYEPKLEGVPVSVQAGREEKLPEIMPEDVMEIVDLEFVAAGDLLSGEVPISYEEDVSDEKNRSDSGRMDNPGDAQKP